MFISEIWRSEKAESGRRGKKKEGSGGGRKKKERRPNEKRGTNETKTGRSSEKEKGGRYEVCWKIVSHDFNLKIMHCNFRDVCVHLFLLLDNGQICKY